MTPEDIDRIEAKKILSYRAPTVKETRELCRLARMALEAGDVVRLVEQYRQEYETPVPDHLLRRNLRERVFEIAAAFLARLEGTDGQG